MVKVVMVSLSAHFVEKKDTYKIDYQEFLRLKSNNHAQSSTSSSVSTACISHSMGSQGPWIIDSGASDHIYGNDFVFSSISSPKFPHFISLADGSKT
ncbi:hypothetical protein CR513_23669, partial [Mucuna pruriens]